MTSDGPPIVLVEILAMKTWKPRSQFHKVVANLFKHRLPVRSAFGYRATRGNSGKCPLPLGHQGPAGTRLTAKNGKSAESALDTLISHPLLGVATSDHVLEVFPALTSNNYFDGHRTSERVELQ